jgi:hypothetical protein
MEMVRSNICSGWTNRTDTGIDDAILAIAVGIFIKIAGYFIDVG